MSNENTARPTWSAVSGMPWVVPVAAVFVAIIAGPASSAGAIADKSSCLEELTKAEDAIVRANIDSSTFRQLNDQLVEMRTLCDTEDFPGAQTRLLDVMNALKDLGSQS
ncbi:MAG: hypothetical protein R3245_06415 [Kiloniellales bacterium]|nr:hypothetical protein [Kiloniellales bacterium]